MTYNIWLANPTHMVYSWDSLCQTVANLVWPAVKQHKSFDHVRVRSTKSKPAPQPYELVVYVMPSQAKAVIGTRFESSSKSSNQYGLTMWDSQETGAEVYVRGLKAPILAKYIYHEILHAKTHHEDSLHHKGGLAAAPMNHDTAKLTTDNTNLLRKYLGHHRPPWTGGFDKIGPGGPINLNDSDDPLAGL